MLHAKSLLLLGGLLFLAGCTLGKTSALPTTSPTATAAPTEVPSTASASPLAGTYTLTQVSEHNNKSDCWLVIDGSVYDVTGFIDEHPGGEEILKGCGEDATALFEAERKHQGGEAQMLLPDYKIGTVQQ